tara:strand:+ start:111 stop:761 length:651 start_codon:yes stop_codon:yes gene_type:complete
MKNLTINDLNNKFTGEGKYIEDNCMYEGSWLNGKRHGYGILTRLKDEYNKEGIKVIFKGSMYKGDWKNDKREGWGEYHGMQEMCKIIFYGQWKDDKKDGWGVFTNERGDVGEGNFGPDNAWNGNQHIWTTSHGDNYVGPMVNGTRTGKKAKFTFSDGRIYEGEVNAGKYIGHLPVGCMERDEQLKWGEEIDGLGKMTYPDGTVEEGIFEKGIFKEK